VHDFKENLTIHYEKGYEISRMIANITIISALKIKVNKKKCSLSNLKLKIFKIVDISI
jgi:tricorn protease-like protein